MPPSAYDSGDLADRYDRGRTLPAGAMDIWLAEVARELPPACGRLLDLGCGTGRFTAPLAARLSVRVCGVDLSRRMLAVARRAFGPSPPALAQASAEALPFPEAAFDFVFLSMVLHHICTNPAALCELARVIRARGVLFVRTPTIETMPSYLWLQFFPEAAAIERTRLLSRRAVGDLLPAFALRGRRTVTQPFADDPCDYCRKIAERTLSSLAAIPDAAFARGLAALERHCAAAPAAPVCEDVEVFVFERSPGA